MLGNCSFGPLLDFAIIFIAFFSSETEFNIPNLLPDGINPHLFDGVNPFNNNLGGFKTTITITFYHIKTVNLRRLLCLENPLWISTSKYFLRKTHAFCKKNISFNHNFKAKA